MEAISPLKTFALKTAAFSLLLLLPAVVSAQTYYRNPERGMSRSTRSVQSNAPRVLVSASECGTLLSSGAFSLRQMADHREWRRENTARRMDLVAWLSAHDAFLAMQKEAQIMHTQKTISCNRFRGQLDVVSTRSRRSVVLDPTPSYLPGRLARTGTLGDEDWIGVLRTPMYLGMTRASTRNAADFYGETDRPTKRHIQARANRAEMNRRFLR